MGNCSEEGPIVVVEDRTVGLTAQNRELVSQHDDLDVLGAAGTNGETDEPDHKAIQGATPPRMVGSRLRRSTATAEFSAPTGADPDLMDAKFAMVSLIRGMNL